MIARGPKGFMPNLFLEVFSNSGERPIWFVMLLAAMASSAIWVVVLLAVMQIAQVPLLTLQGYSIVGNIFGFSFLWCEATVWFHLVYLLQAHSNNDADAKEREVEVWISPIGMLVMFFAKAGWMILKYAVAPLIPIVLVSELGDMLGFGAILFDIASMFFLLYPVCGIAIYLVQRHRVATRSRVPVEDADTD